MKPRVNLGIPEVEREQIAKGLSVLLAESFSLYLKTHHFHWNVSGPLFSTLHELFETQYTELWNALDEIAERIRALDEYAPGTFTEFMKLSSIPETQGIPKAQEMIMELLQGQEALARTARSIFPVAEEGSDEATLDLLTQRIQLHEKTAWMLRSLLRD